MAILDTEHPVAHKSTATVLDSAIRQRMSLLARLLIYKGACTWKEPSHKSDRGGWPCCCLCTAVKMDDLRTVQVLISRDAVGTYVDNYYYRHVHNFACYGHAAWMGNLDITVLLMRDGPRVPSRVHSRMLTYALRQDHRAIMHRLLCDGTHRPTFADVDTAMRAGQYDMLLDLVRAGGVEMRAEEGHNKRMVLVQIIDRVADAVRAGTCPAEVLRRLLACTAMAWTCDSANVAHPRRSYLTLARKGKGDEWWAVVGALTEHGWTCAAQTPGEIKTAADAHSAGGAADAAYAAEHTSDYANAKYDTKGDESTRDDDDHHEGDGSSKRPRCK